ncbi:MAG: carboxypeptidase-like regulatory domain-containing protein [Thermoplasmatota archaeon]
MARRALALLAVVSLLAGCSQAPEPPADAANVSVPGTLAGVVIDEAIRPISGAAVAVPAFPDLAPVLTADDGAFVLSDLAPGVVILQVTKDGYLSQTIQAEVPAADDQAPLLQVQLARDAEAAPYAIVEAFDGFIDCGAGSSVVFGFTFACQNTVQAAFPVLCNGSPPVPPTGVCLPMADPYAYPQATGNMSMVQTELVWTPSSAGSSDLLLLSQVLDPNGQVVPYAGSSVDGPSYLVSRLNATQLQEFGLTSGNHFGLFVSVGPTQPANLVLQQSYRIFHTTAYRFEFEQSWTFIEDGAPLPPPACTTCLAAGTPP